MLQQGPSKNPYPLLPPDDKRNGRLELLADPAEVGDGVE